MLNTTTSENAPQCTIDILAEVIFGSPGRACAGSGVCRLIPFHKLSSWKSPCPRFDANIQLFDNERLDIILDLKLINRESLLKWFSNTYFLVEEDFFFPLWLQHKLGQTNIYIPAGKYSFLFKNDQLIINLVCQKETYLIDDRLKAKIYQKAL